MDNNNMEPIIEEKKSGAKTAWSIIKTIINVIFWLAIIALAVVWITDFIMVRSEKEPIFCIDTKIHEFDDGTVEECTGLGYKVYDYNRTSLDAYEFGPFFIEMREKE